MDMLKMSPGLSQQVHQVLPTPEQLPRAKGGAELCPAGPAGHARLSLHSLLNTTEEATRTDGFNIAAFCASRYHLLKPNVNSCDGQSKSGFNVHTQLSKAAGDVSKYIRKFKQEKTVYYGISLLVI